MSRTITQLAVRGRVRSADGTTIAYERLGRGPTLVLVEAAGGYRRLGPSRWLPKLLAADFAVVTYDRRGRGESGDTPPYAVEREVEDLAALLAATGGPAHLYGSSSGACLALHAAASGLAVSRLAVFEPPVALGGAGDPRESITQLSRLVAARRYAAAVEYFHAAIGAPPEVLAQMAPRDRAALEAIAPTLVYDWMIAAQTSRDVVAAVRVPTLVMDSQRSSHELTRWAAAVVEALPDPTYRALPGGWHGVADVDLVTAMREHFLGRAEAARPASGALWGADPG